MSAPLCATYPTKGTEWCLASRKRTVLGHWHISVHRMALSLLKRKIRQHYKGNLYNSLPPGLWTALLIDLQPMIWKLWFTQCLLREIAITF